MSSMIKPNRTERFPGRHSIDLLDREYIGIVEHLAAGWWLMRKAFGATGGTDARGATDQSNTNLSGSASPTHNRMSWIGWRRF